MEDDLDEVMDGVLMGGVKKQKALKDVYPAGGAYDSTSGSGGYPLGLPEYKPSYK